MIGSSAAEQTQKDLQQAPHTTAPPAPSVPLEAPQPYGSTTEGVAEAEQPQDNDGSKEEEEDPSADKKFKCPQCSHAFSRRHNLKSHMLTHTHEKPFACNICSSKFRRLHDLKRHEKLHTGEKPFKCDTCGRRFARLDALTRHNQSEAGCAMLIDDTTPATPVSSEPSDTKEQTLLKPSIPLKRTYETTRWRIDPPSSRDAYDKKEERVLPSISDVARLVSLVDTTPLRPLEVSSGAREDVGVLRYVQALEQRVQVLEHKLSDAQVHIKELQSSIDQRSTN